MKRCWLVLCLLGLSWLPAGLAADDARTYYFQLICGSDKELATKVDAKPIGLKLRSELEAKFRWKSYAELAHGECNVSEVKTTSIKLPERREMQLQLSGKSIETRLYRDGQMVRKSRENADSKLLIMGGDQGRDDSWFIVIRRDKPATFSAETQQAKRTD